MRGFVIVLAFFLDRTKRENMHKGAVKRKKNVTQMEVLVMMINSSFTSSYLLFASEPSIDGAWVGKWAGSMGHFVN